MNYGALFRSALVALLRNKMRSILTVLGITIAIAASVPTPFPLLGPCRFRDVRPPQLVARARSSRLIMNTITAAEGRADFWTPYAAAAGRAAPFLTVVAKSYVCASGKGG